MLTPEQLEQLSLVLNRLVAAIHANAPIMLPRAGESGQFSGFAGDFAYCFDAEEDLLHLSITRRSGEDLSPEEAQRVVAAILPDFPPGLMWLKPAVESQHFYLGQDELVAVLEGAQSRST